jgi:hypothetical protein
VPSASIIPRAPRRLPLSAPPHRLADETAGDRRWATSWLPRGMTWLLKRRRVRPRSR